MKFSNRKICFVIFAIVFVTLFVFWDFIASRTLEMGMRFYSSHYLQTDIQIKKIGKENGNWVVEYPALEKNGITVCADRILIDCQFYPLIWTLDLMVRVDNSAIFIDHSKAVEMDDSERRGASFLGSMVQSLLSQNHFLKFLNVKSNLSVKKGIIAWEKGYNTKFERDGEGGGYVEFKSDDKGKGVSEGTVASEGKVEVNGESPLNHFTAKDHDRNLSQLDLCQFDLHLESNNQKKKIDFQLFQGVNQLKSFSVEISSENTIYGILTFNHMDCSRVTKWLAAFDITLSGWNILKGDLNGQVDVHYPEIGPPYAWGSASLSNLQFVHPKMKIAGEIEKVNFDLKIDRRVERGNHSKVLPILGEVTIVNGGRLTIYRKERPYWEIRDLRGGISLIPPYMGKGFWVNESEGVMVDSEHDGQSELSGSFEPLIKLALNGNCFHLDHSFEMALEGVGQFQNKNEASLDFTLKKGRFDLQNETKGDELLIRFIAEKIGASENEAKIEIQHLGKSEWPFVQTILGQIYPQLHNYEMLNGDINAFGVGQFNGWMLGLINFSDIRAFDLTFDYLGEEEAGSLASVGGWSSGEEEAGSLAGGVGGWFSGSSAREKTRSFNISSIIGQLSASNQPDHFSTLNAHFKVNDGSFNFQGFNGKPWSFQGVTTELKIENGNPQKSIFNGDFFGLNSELVVDWFGESYGQRGRQIILDFTLNGQANKLALLVPETFKKRVEKAFCLGEQMVLSAKIKPNVSEKSVEGVFRLIGGEISDSESVTFGCDLLFKSNKGHNKKELNQMIVDQRQLQRQLQLQLQNDLETQQNSFLCIPAMIQLAPSNQLVHNGWFKAKNISLEKFVSPFIFSDNEANLTGRGMISGFFDQSGLSLDYELNQAALENDNFLVKVDQVKSQTHPKYHYKQLATYYIDFSQGSYSGSLPLVNSSYFDKKSGLLFTNLNSYVSFFNNQINFSELELLSNGIYISGDLDVVLDDPKKGFFDVIFSSQIVNGKISQIQDFISHFDPTLPWISIPIEGDVSFSNKGIYVKLSMTPSDYTVETDIKGQVNRGVAIFERPEIALHNLKFDFMYTNTKNMSEISKIHGLLTFGSSLGKNYILSGDHIRFDDLRNRIGRFDVWLGDRQRDLIRFIGTTRLVKDGKQLAQEDSRQYPQMEVVINKDLFHIGDLYPEAFELVLDGWTKVQRFKLQAGVNLKRFFRDFQGMIQTRNSDYLQMEGDLQVSFGYNASDGLFHYLINGQEVGLGEKKIKKLVIDGFKQENLWTLKHIGVDDLTVTGQLQKVKRTLNGNRAWEINELTLNHGNWVKLRLSDVLAGKNSRFRGKIQDFEIDLSQLDRYPIFADFSRNNSPKGILNGRGEISLELVKGDQGWKGEVNFEATLRKWGGNGLLFSDVDHVSCLISSDRGLVFQNIDTHVIDPFTFQNRGKLKIDRAERSFDGRHVEFDRVHFSVNEQDLHWMVDTLSKKFSLLASSELMKIVKELKGAGDVKGSYHYEFTDPYVATELSLEDGLYTIAGQDYRLKNFNLECDPFEIRLGSQCDFDAMSPIDGGVSISSVGSIVGDHALNLTVSSSSNQEIAEIDMEIEKTPLWIHGRFNYPELTEGELILSEQSLTGLKALDLDHAIFVKLKKNGSENEGDFNKPQWVENSKKLDIVNQFKIENIRGQCSGLSCFLEKEPAEDEVYVGVVVMDFPVAKRYFSEGLATKMGDWKLEGRYLLNGKWKFDHAKEGHLADKVRYRGDLTADDFIVHGYEFDQLRAQLRYDSGVLHVTDLAVNDGAGDVIIEEMEFYKDKVNRWNVTLPKLMVKNFRPSLLKDEKKSRETSANSFMVKDLVLEGCEGCLGDGTSFVGKGSFSFTNRAKQKMPVILAEREMSNAQKIGQNGEKVIQNALFQIPSDVIARLGLDPVVMTPVTGRVDYVIEGDKIIFKKFKDVYSEGKLSRFQLAKVGRGGDRVGERSQFGGYNQARERGLGVKSGSGQQHIYSGLERSYIDFDGHLNLWIKMKQHNLMFKFAEFFTLGIQGTLQEPIYEVILDKGIAEKEKMRD